MVYDCMPNFIQIGLFCHPRRAQNPKFGRIFNFNDFGTYTKLNVAGLHNEDASLTIDIKIVSELQLLNGEVAFTVFIVQYHDIPNFFAPPLAASCEIRAQSNLPW